MNIQIFLTREAEYEIVKTGETKPEGDLLAEGEHALVMLQIQKMLGNSKLSFGESGFDEVTDGTQVGTINDDDKWLLIEVEPFKRARIFKNPQGTTQTKLRTWKGGLTEIIAALYGYLNNI